MNTIKINGKTIITSGKGNIVVVNGKIIVDGSDVTPTDKEINIEVTGNVEKLEVEYCNKITVTGDAKQISATSGDIEVAGAVSGSVQSTSGDIECGNVNGNVSTMSGDIHCGDVKGDVDTMSGDIRKNK